MTGLLLLGAGLLILLSAILSAAESAAFGVSASRIRTLLAEGFGGAEGLETAREREETLRPTIFFVNGALNLGAAGLLVGTASLGWGARSLLWAVPGAALGVLLVSEGIPRVVATLQPIRLALFTAPLLLTVERSMKPLLAPIALTDRLLQRRNGQEEDSPEERELQELTALGRREGVVEEEEHLLVERAFRMDELTAWDIMTPRVDIFAWRDDIPLEEIVAKLKTIPHSRVPVYGESIDDITGILYVREAYEAYVGGRGSLPLSALSREPFFVPGSLSLPRLLRDFQLRRIHMGIVADEFGGTDGLVTLEDVIEELVGEIEDETDISEEAIHRISRNEVEASGAVELREVNYAFNVSLPQLEYRSLNGFILEEMGRVPEVGERLELPGLEIEILEATETQVMRARIRKLHTTPIDED